MTIVNLSADHPWVKYPAFYNAYSLHNEVSAACERSAKAHAYSDIYLDDYYGRIFDEESRSVSTLYGKSSKMHYYVAPDTLEIVDEVRVPYRRIPIFSADNLTVIERRCEKLRAANSSHEILLRGQTRLYSIPRSTEECVHFYGEETVKEPSFLPSHLRHHFDPYFLKCMWQSQAAILLHDIGIDVANSLGGSEQVAFLKDAASYRNSPLFVLFSLGIAQHYGMPSVGLDLTDDLKVAGWFATHNIRTDSSGLARTELIEFNADQSPTIFVFRCPRDAVFDYSTTRLPRIPDGRPDHQKAWFGYVGWGAASNQLASYLMCGFRLTSDVGNALDIGLDRDLFPTSQNDPLLRHFLTMKSFDKYEGEAKRALQSIYYMND